MSFDPKIREEIKKRVLDESVFGPMVDDLFNSVDSDKNGFIDRAELKKLLAEIGQVLEIPPPSDEDVDNELKRLDDNKDGKISKQELRKLVKELVLVFTDNI